MMSCRMLVETIMRGPRLWSNTEIRKFAPLFTGDIINVSGAQDSDKEIQRPLKYLFTTRYDDGGRYRDYFRNAGSYAISNYAKDSRRGHAEQMREQINIDLEEDLPKQLSKKFDVVLNHTVLEHVFHVFKAFKNLCLLSRDIVMLVVPAVQMIHDYDGAYRDYWRFTPFAVEKLFANEGFTVLYRSSNRCFMSSIYYFYIASCKPGKWSGHGAFRNSFSIGQMNYGHLLSPISYFQLKVERALRKGWSKVSS